MRSNVIRSADYERYYIPVSLKNLVGKKRNIYISGELEKRHPCYTDACEFDSKVRLRNKSLILDVVVINKLKLSEYKRKSRVIDLGFFLDKEISVLRFSDKKKLLVIFFSFGILLTGIYSVLKSAERKKEKEVVIESIESEFIEDMAFESIPELLGGKFLEIVSVKKGMITDFDWKIENGMEFIQGNLNKVFPEEIEISGFENISSVEYVNNSPVFNFELRQQIREKENNEKNCLFEVYAPELRKEILMGEGVLLEEKRKSSNVRFRCKNNLMVLSNLARALEAKDIGVNELRIMRDGKEYLMVEMTLSESYGYKSGIPIDVMPSYSKIFIEEKEKSIQKNLAIPEKTGEMKKVGSVGYENGKKLVFYKNPEGKLVKVMEND